MGNTAAPGNLHFENRSGFPDRQVRPPRVVSIVVLMAAGLLAMPRLSVAQDTKQLITIDQMMTPQQLKDTGVSTLTSAQRKALDAWLNFYTETVIKIASGKVQTSESSPPTSSPTTPAARSGARCVPAIESTISGDFEGWEGETLFKLDNGQIWEQAEYDYMYSYQYRPDVTIYETSAGCRMKVQDEDETIVVRRIK